MFLIDLIRRIIQKIKRLFFKKKDDVKREKTSLDLFIKHGCNPIISPLSENKWETWQTFNPGAIFLGGKVHFLYRAIGDDGVSRLGYASSEDGFSINDRLPYPVYRHKKGEGVFNYYSYVSGGSFGGAEDPRMVKMKDEDRVYVTYTAFGDGIRVALTSIGVNDFLNHRWKWKKPLMLSPANEVHKNWLLFPEKINGKYAILHSINPEIQVEYLDDLSEEGIGYIDSNFGGGKSSGWDTHIRGAAAPPIRTEDGWLVFYHAMSEGQDQYKVGAFLLDLNDPTIILNRARSPLLEPILDYENDGHKSGVVYVSGAVVKNGELMIYYGGSDSYVCVAHAPLRKVLDFIKSNNQNAYHKREC